MKTIENKETSLLLTEDTKVKYSDLIMTVLSGPVKEGITIPEMRRDLKLYGIAENAKVGDSMEFTEDEIKHIISLVNAQKWAVKHIDILEFADYVENV